MKKALHIAGNILTVLILIFALCMTAFTIISVRTLGGNANILGYKPYIVLSDSMRDTFQVGDISVSKAVDPATLEPGDIVTFTSIDPDHYGEVVTHKIREITTYEGQPAFVTYGTTTGEDDAYPAPFDQVVGEYVFCVPKLGYFFQFLKTPAGYVTVILLPFLVLIGLQIVRFVRLIGQYRKEQKVQLDETQSELEAERAESRRMREELARLRAQVGGSHPEDEPVSVAAAAAPERPGPSEKPAQPAGAPKKADAPARTERAEEPEDPEDEFDVASIVSEFTGGEQ